jgi:hypothetical protein
MNTNLKHSFKFVFGQVEAHIEVGQRVFVIGRDHGAVSESSVYVHGVT